MEIKPAIPRLAVLLLLAAAGLAGQDPQPPAATPFPALEIFLLESLPANPESRLQEVTLGIETRAAMYYKLSLDDEVIAAGMLQQGINHVIIPLEIVFAPEYTRLYSLETQWQDKPNRKNIEITILTQGAAGGTSEGKLPAQLPVSLSLYFKDLLLYRGKKELKKTSLLTLEKIRKMPSSNPVPSPSALENSPRSSSISIPGLVLGALGLLKEKRAAQKLKAWEAEKRKKNAIEWILKKKEPDGSEHEMQVQIRLHLKPADSATGEKAG